MKLQQVLEFHKTNIFEQRLDHILIMLETGQHESKILTQLDNLCHQLNIPITVIGGMAVTAHGYQRYTADIDILITQQDATTLAKALLQSGWINIGHNTLQDNNTKVLINFCAEGIKAGRVTFPPPDHTNPGIKIADLPLLIILKIKANRHKDRSDVVELIKANKLTIEFLTTNISPSLSAIDKQLLQSLWKTAMKEQNKS